MATVKSFEDLIVWQKARELTKFIYDISKYGNFERDKGLADQIRRASVSVMSNIAEGFDRGTKQELINYLFIAKGSCGEVRTQLYIASDAEYIDMSKFRYGLRMTDECSRLLKSFIDKVKTGAHSGVQYKKEYRRGMSETNKIILENSPEMKEYYNTEKDEIEFWRYHEDQKAKEDREV
ncbi:MAG: four helix bundle protein [Parcubacteria group bacterium]|nr:four helix bundle protein [Parcubacteria group bacterium]